MRAILTDTFQTVPKLVMK